jgi:hypothetical protein
MRKTNTSGTTVADSRPGNFFAGVENSGEPVQPGRPQRPTSHRGKRFQKKPIHCGVGHAKHFIAVSSGFPDLACQEPAFVRKSLPFAGCDGRVVLLTLLLQGRTVAPEVGTAERFLPRCSMG